MLSSQSEKLLAKILGYGAAFAAIFVVTSGVTDPVNAPKLLAIGVVSTAALGILFSNSLKLLLSNLMVPTAMTVVFLLSTLNATINSQSPFSQNLYGAYGRNNGLIAYLFLALILIASASLTQQRSFGVLVRSLLFAGVVNIMYCAWVLLFGDFIGWSNPYGNILGTFGNPNFIGAFLGIFLTAYVAYAISSDTSSTWRWSLIVVVPVTTWAIIESSAIQGRVVAAGGLALVFFSYLRFRVNKFILVAYSFSVAVIGFIAALGALQVGPLTQFIYKTSVSLRGQYWLSGWNTGESHPFNGAGMDALGDWYRRSRDPQALVTPGVNTVVNAAHNVFMDMFAFGGWPLLLSYSLIVGYTGVALVRAFLRLKAFDGTFIALATAWIGYQVQSLISINQIGLAVWGWVLSGSIIAFERHQRKQSTSIGDAQKPPKAVRATKQRSSGGVESKQILMAFSFGIVGIFLAVPPLASDASWKEAMNRQSVVEIEKSMNESYFNPNTTNRFLVNVQTLESSNFPELAHKYALAAVKWNPESFDVWRMLYLVRNSSQDEKSLALENMRRLDPLNPDVTLP
jgi:hypothetical protein